MGKHEVLVFRPYPLEVGQKIHIAGGARRGDWEVIGCDERKMRLRCPVSFKEVEWDRFCVFVEKRADAEWPRTSWP
jgi:hypothetical protein